MPMTRPLSLNSREHWRVKAKRVSEVRQATALLTRSAHVPPLKHISVEMHYQPRDKRRRDPLNLVATLKAVEDGIVDAGVIPDDNPNYLTPVMPIIDAPSSTPAIYFIIKELDADKL